MITRANRGAALLIRCGGRLDKCAGGNIAERAVLVRDDEVPLPVHRDLGNWFAMRSASDGDWFKPAPNQTGEIAGFVTDPYCAVAVLEKRGNAAVLQFGGVRGIENFEAHTIITNKAAEGGEPKITV